MHTYFEPAKSAHTHTEKYKCCSTTTVPSSLYLGVCEPDLPPRPGFCKTKRHKVMFQYKRGVTRIFFNRFEFLPQPVRFCKIMLTLEPPPSRGKPRRGRGGYFLWMAEKRSFLVRADAGGMRVYLVSTCTWCFVCLSTQNTTFLFVRAHFFVKVHFTLAAAPSSASRVRQCSTATPQTATEVSHTHTSTCNPRPDVPHSHALPVLVEDILTFVYTWSIQCIDCIGCLRSKLRETCQVG